MCLKFLKVYAVGITIQPADHMCERQSDDREDPL